MAKTRGSGRRSSSTTHSSSPLTTSVPISMTSPSSASPKPVAVVHPPFVAPGADKVREPPSVLSSSSDTSDDPEVTFEGSTEPTSPPPPQNKRKSRVSLRLVGKASAKKQRTEEPELTAKAKPDRFRMRKFAKGYMRSGNKFSLPHAPLITTILEYYNVPLKKEGQQTSQADVMGKSAMHKLGVEIRNGEFCFIEEEPQDEEVGEATEEQPPEQHQEHTQDGTDPLVLIRKEILAGFEVLYEKVDAVDRKYDAVVVQMDRLTREVASLRESTTISSTSLVTSLTQNHAAIMEKLEEFEGTTVEQEEDKEEEEPAQEQPTAPTPAP